MMSDAQFAAQRGWTSRSGSRNLGALGRRADIVFDCRRASSLARFWASVLDGYVVSPYDDAEIQRLAAMGRTPETDPTARRFSPICGGWGQRTG
jgi:hypothetical protein